MTVDARGPARFAGKVALVTGAASGIGHEIATRLTAEGATVIAADLRDIDATGERFADVVAVDTSQPEQVDTLVAQCKERFGGLDVVFNNAGVNVSARTRIHETPISEWDRVLDVNLRGAFLVLRAVLGLMVSTRRVGAIVNTASLASFRGSPGASPYVASKGGLLMLTRTAALEYVEEGIRVNAVCPAAVATPMMAAVDMEHVAVFRSHIPMGRLGLPKEIASLALFLASDEASFITGVGYVIDGGRSAG